ncbi:unnamed protein product [Leptosia nina]|uniref:Uncharacterized protein n=1 Tax=Leptosia nina TaxID=320188 RepID=A0AAV1J467_9NEOP
MGPTHFWDTTTIEFYYYYYSTSPWTMSPSIDELLRLETSPRKVSIRDFTVKNRLLGAELLQVIRGP